MRVKGYYENGSYELFDENGMLVADEFESEQEMRVYCEQNEFILTEIFNVVLTNSI